MHESDPRHGVGSSGVAETPQHLLDMIQHIPVRLLTSPLTDPTQDIQSGSTPLSRTHENMTLEVVT